jgi:hypothetical protein
MMPAALAYALLDEVSREALNRNRARTAARESERVGTPRSRTRSTRRGTTA